MSTTTIGTRTSNVDWAALIRKYAIVGILLLLVIAVTVFTQGAFVSPRNMINVVRQVAGIGIIATGMTFVIIILGIDLSVGSILAVAAVVSASLSQLPDASSPMYPGILVHPAVALLAGLGAGALLGLINGSLIAKLKIAPFIATLGMMTAASGAALMYSDGRPVSGLNEAFKWIGQGDLLFIPVPIWLLVLVAGSAHFVLNYTRFGRHAYAIGGNEQAARVSGIGMDKIKISVFTLSGLLAGLSGVILAARTGSGNPTLGTGIELDAIAAAVIGGTSFSGGVGTIWGTVVGALIIGIIDNGLDLVNVNTFMKKIVKGAIIVIAIVIDERKNH